jgi:hypothetical protein
MTQPKNTVSDNKFVYIKNNVIFNILDKDNGDSCSMKLSTSNVPYITVKEDETEYETKKYFDSLIEVGDTYSDAIFYKTVHSNNKNEEKSQKFQNYYHDVFEEELKSLIANLNFSTNEEFKNYISGSMDFPIYMIKGMGYSIVEENVQINLTDAKYKELKENKLKELALNTASSLLNSYGYEITSGTIDIKEKE